MNYIDPIENFAVSNVLGQYSDTDTLITLEDASKFPDPSTEGQYNIVWFNYTDYPEVWNDPSLEIVRVIAKTGNTLTVLRGQEGTTPSIKNLQNKTYRTFITITKNTLETIDNALASAVGASPNSINLSDFNSLQDAINSVAGAEKVINIDRNEVLTSNVTVPKNITLNFIKGFKISGPYTLTIDGIIKSEPNTIFGTDITVKGNPEIGYALPEWFENSGDDATSIVKALDLKHKVLFIPGKTYTIDSTVEIIKTRRELIAHGAKFVPGANLGNNFMFHFHSDFVNNIVHTYLWFRGGKLELGNANGIHIQGMHEVFLKEVYIQDNTSSQVIGIQVTNSFNVWLENVGLHSSNSTETTLDTTKQSVALKLVGDPTLNGKYDYITNVGISDSLIHGWYNAIEFNNSASASYSTNFRIHNTAINNTVNDSIVINGSIAGLDVTDCHFEISGNHILNANNTHHYTLIRWISNSVWNTPKIFNLTGSGQITLSNNRFHGNTQSPKYNLFNNNDFTVVMLDKQSIYTATYDLKPISGTGTITNNFRRVVDKTSSFALNSNYENTTITNKGATSGITCTLPSADSVSKGWRFNIVVLEPQNVSIAPQSTDEIIGAGGVGTKIKSSLVGAHITLESDGAGKWYVVSQHGFFEQPKEILEYSYSTNYFKVVSLNDPEIIKIISCNGSNKQLKMPGISKTVSRTYTISNLDSTNIVTVVGSDADLNVEVATLNPGQTITAFNIGDRWVVNKLSDLSGSSSSTGANVYNLSDYSGLRALVNIIGTNEATIIVDKSNVLSLDQVIPENITLEFKKGNVISGAYTLTINGPIVAGAWQIFGSDLTVDGNPKITEVYPEWFGAVGDGVTDDTQALQKTLDSFKGYKIKFSPKTYITTKYLHIWSNTTIEGISNKTLIYNKSTEPQNKGYGIVVKTGSFHYPWFTEENYNDGNTNQVSNFVITERYSSGVSVGQTQFIVNVANINEYKVGKICWLHGEAGKLSGSNYLIPYFSMISEIKEVDTTTNTITIETPIYMDYPYPVKLKILKDDSNAIEGVVSGTKPRYIGKNITIRNLMFKSDTDNWIREAGSYKCTYENITVESPINFNGGTVMGNGYVNCIFRNIKGYNSRGVVFGLFSSFNTVEDIYTYLDGNSPITKGVFYLNEFVHNNYINRYRVFCGADIQQSLFIIEGYRNTIENSEFVLESIGRTNTAKAGIIHQYLSISEKPNNESIIDELQNRFINNTFNIGTLRFAFASNNNGILDLKSNNIYIDNLTTRFSGDTESVRLYNNFRYLNTKNYVKIVNADTVPVPALVDKGKKYVVEDKFIVGSVDVKVEKPVYYLSDFTNLSDAISYIGTTESILVIDKDSVLTSDLTIPKNITLKWYEGNLISGSYTLTINGSIEAGIFQIFGINLIVNGANAKIVESYPEWFNAKGDGVADDYDALQKCIDAFKTMKLSSKTYKVRQPLYMYSNYRLKGSGSESIIWNKGTDNSHPLGKEAILIGNMKGDPSTWTDLTSRGTGVTYTETTSNIHKVSTYWIQLVNTSGFNVNDLIWIYSKTKGSVQSNGKYLPVYQQINKILEIDTANNKIRVEQPIYMDIDDILYVVKNNGTDEYYMAENVIIENVAFKADADTWYRLGGAYKCAIRDIWAECKGSGIVFNGYAYSIIENAHINAKRSNVDLGHFCHFSTFDKCYLTSYNPSYLTVADIGIYEGSHDNTFINCVFNAIGSETPDLNYHGINISNAQANFYNCNFSMGNNTRLIQAINIDGNNRWGISRIENCVFNAKDVNYVIACTASDLVIRNSYIKANPIYATGLLAVDSNGSAPNLIVEDVVFNVTQKAQINNVDILKDINHQCRWLATYLNAYPSRDDIINIQKYMQYEINYPQNKRKSVKVRGTKINSTSYVTVLKTYFAPNEIVPSWLMEFGISGICHGNKTSKSTNIRMYTTDPLNPEYEITLTTGAVANQIFKYDFKGGIADFGSPYFRFLYERYDNSGHSYHRIAPTIDSSQGITIEIRVKVNDIQRSNTIGTGDGTATIFSGTLTKIPIRANTVEVSYTIGGTSYVATDDGNGNISGTNITSGTVDYSTGNVSLTFSTAPDNATDIIVNYYQDLAGEDITPEITYLKCEQ